MSRPAMNIAVDFRLIKTPHPQNKMNWPTQFLSHSPVYSLEHVQGTQRVSAEEPVDAENEQMNMQ